MHPGDGRRRSGASVDEIAERVAGVVSGAPGAGEVVVLDATHDSRRVEPGSLFCAVPGATVDGHAFVDQAVERGASALLVDHLVDPVGGVEHAPPQIVVDDVRAAMGPAASLVWGDPSRHIDVIGVTGTNGKTTVVTLVDQLLDALGRPCQVIGTLTGERTTPEGTDLQRTLAAAVAAGSSAVAMEVSSHALDLRRVDGTRFAVCAFTNLGIDHLDYHETPERYFAAKARLFEPGWSPIAVVNVDDVHGRLLRDAASAEGSPEIVPVTLENAVVGLGSAGSHLSWRGHVIDLPLLGRFNASNALIAAECVVALGVDHALVAEHLHGVAAPPGRLDPVEMGQPFCVVVDYAHTPDALEQVLTAARELGPGQLRVVFGAGGERDRTKRPAMGAAAAGLADDVTITSDNPRSEDPSTIMSEVLDGIVITTDRPTVTSIEDRAEAIRSVLTRAVPGDVVVIAGKGHETTQDRGGVVAQFDDREVAAAALVALGYGSPG